MATNHTLSETSSGALVPGERRVNVERLPAGDGVKTQSTAARRELEDKLRHCQKPECNAEFHVEQGDPAEEIIRVAQDAQCDLIVMGSHGRPGLRPLLLGSVAEKTLRGASCPVLLVKHPLAGIETSPKAQPQTAGAAKLSEPPGLSRRG